MRRVLLVLPAVALLAGCGYLLDGPFPEYVTRMVSQEDISGVIPYAPGAHYEIRVVNSPAGDTVWVYGESAEFAERFALFDDDLELLLGPREEAAGEDKFFSDSLLMFDAAGAFYVGKLVYSLGFAPQTDATWGWQLGYYDPGSARYTFPYVTGQDTINRDEWTGPTTNVGPIAGGTISGIVYTYGGFEALSHDMQGGQVALYAWPFYPFDHLVQGVVGAEASFVSGLFNPMTSDTRAFTIDVGTRDFDRPQFAGSGTVIRFRDDEKMVFYDLKGDEVETYWARDHGDIRYAYSPGGEYWYILDPERGTLTKARTWW